MSGSNLKRFVDLHTHTTASDGTESPTQVVGKAHALGLVGIAITDHDTIQGIDEGLRAGTNLGIEVVPGVEISCKWQDHRIHLLGFYINTQDSGLLSLLKWMQVGRQQRLPKMLEKLRELGVNINQDEVVGEAGLDEGMPRLAQLVSASPLEAAVHDAYGRALGENSYNVLGAEYANRDVGSYLGKEFGGEFLDQYTLREPKQAMPIYHLIGALDPLSEADIATRIDDGYPETLPEWINADGLTHMKIKLNGDDLQWDVARVVSIERIAAMRDVVRVIGKAAGPG